LQVIDQLTGRPLVEETNTRKSSRTSTRNKKYYNDNIVNDEIIDESDYHVTITNFLNSIYNDVKRDMDKAIKINKTGLDYPLIKRNCKRISESI